MYTGKGNRRPGTSRPSLEIIVRAKNAIFIVPLPTSGKNHGDNKRQPSHSMTAPGVWQPRSGNNKRVGPMGPDSYTFYHDRCPVGIRIPHA